MAFMLVLSPNRADRVFADDNRERLSLYFHSLDASPGRLHELIALPGE
jgi:hypothetical protein